MKKTLSDKINDAGHLLHSTKVIRVVNMKEFIKKIKERIATADTIEDIFDIINEEAGEKLVKW